MAINIQDQQAASARKIATQAAEAQLLQLGFTPQHETLWNHLLLNGLAPVYSAIDCDITYTTGNAQTYDELKAVAQEQEPDLAFLTPRMRKGMNDVYDHYSRDYSQMEHEFDEKMHPAEPLETLDHHIMQSIRIASAKAVLADLDHTHSQGTFSDRHRPSNRPHFRRR